MPTFDQLVQIPTADGKTRLAAPADWTQGRALFGGLVAAAGLNAMRALVAPDRPPRAMQIVFVAPVSPGEASVEATLLREGRAVSVAEVKITQGGAVCASIIGSFGADRPSAIRVNAPNAPAAKIPDECPEMPYVEGMTPAFTQHLQFRWALGEIPFSGSTSREIGGWCRFRDSDEPVTHEHILGLVDAWPPTVLSNLSSPAAGSSLTWTIQFLQWPSDARSNQWWFYRAETDAAAHGYAQTRAVLWSPDGLPAALSNQTVAIFG